MYDDDDIPRRSGRRNGGGGTGILYAAVLVAVAGGVWYFWNGSFDMEKAKSIVIGDLFSKTADKAIDAAPLGAASLKEKGESFMKSATEMLIEKPKNIAENLFANVKSAAVDSARTEAAKLLGVPAGTLGEDPGVSIVRPVRQNLSLLFGADREDLLYSIDWGDKQAESGSVKKGEGKSVDHLWNDVGEYSITVIVTGNETGKKTYSFPVTIQK